MNLRSQTATSNEERAEQLVDVIGARVHVDIVIPGTNIQAKMRLCSRREVSEARAEARKALRDAGFPIDSGALVSLAGDDEWTFELAVRVLQRAVRNPSDVSLELAPLEDWRECTDSQIEALGKRYEDLEAELDPLGDNKAAISEAEYEAILAAAKKKERVLLISFGSPKLATFIRTSVERLSTSPTPTS